MTTDLPSFSNPPVTETVLSVSFRPIEDLSLVQLARFHEIVRSEFPKVEDQPPYQMPLERFGSARDVFTLQVPIPQAFLPRFWLSSEDAASLLQLQRDWFAYNWRRPPGQETSYTRYPNGREKFSRHLESLCSHLESESGSRPSFNQCEVTYINTILPSGVWESHADLDKVTPLWRAVEPEGSNESIEQERLAVTVGISYQDAQVGRLHVSFSPSNDPSGNPTFVLNLTARGRPIGEDVAGVLAFLDLGRTSVVNNFVRFTTSELHEVWGKL